MNTPKINKKSGFTLLEIIIVIIIIGVLASLALPKLFNTVEYSRVTEAVGNIQALRGALERCYVGAGNQSYGNCTDLNALDIANPSNAAGHRFGYAVAAGAADAYVITATRNTVEGGSIASNITVTVTTVAITRSGATAFAAFK